MIECAEMQSNEYDRYYTQINEINLVNLDMGGVIKTAYELDKNLVNLVIMFYLLY